MSRIYQVGGRSSQSNLMEIVKIGGWTGFFKKRVLAKLKKVGGKTNVEHVWEDFFLKN